MRLRFMRGALNITSEAWTIEGANPERAPLLHADVMRHHLMDAFFGYLRVLNADKHGETFGDPNFDIEDPTAGYELDFRPRLSSAELQSVVGGDCWARPVLSFVL